MKVLLIHNYYQQRGGEDQVFEAEQRLLQRAGFEVHTWTDNNHRIRSAWDRIKTAWRTPFNPESQDALKKVLKENWPDVVHIHNTFPLISPSILETLHEARIPTVATLHNFRLFCSNGLLLRDGKPCEECLKSGSVYPAIKHGCYRSSRLATLPVARLISSYGPKYWNERIAKFFVLSEFSRQKFIQAGLDPSRLIIKPNFTTLPEDLGQAPDYLATERNHALFIGRVSPEKGVATLIEAWKRCPFPLRIIGNGPLRNALANQALSNVTWLGSLDKRGVYSELQKARILILPSECFENFPVTLAEAASMRVPVLAARIGSLQSWITDDENGWLFEPGNATSLEARISALWSDTERLSRVSRAAYQRFQSQFSAEAGLVSLQETYSSLRDHR